MQIKEEYRGHFSKSQLFNKYCHVLVTCCCILFFFCVSSWTYFSCVLYSLSCTCILMQLV